MCSALCYHGCLQCVTGSDHIHIVGCEEKGSNADKEKVIGKWIFWN